MSKSQTAKGSRTQHLSPRTRDKFLCDHCSDLLKARRETLIEIVETYAPSTLRQGKYRDILVKAKEIDLNQKERDLRIREKNVNQIESHFAKEIK